MSDIDEVLNKKDDFLKNLEEEKEFDKKKKELEHHRVNVQHDRLKDNEQKYEAIKKSTFGTISDERAQELAQESADYLEAAAKPLTFINKDFRGVVPFFAKNLILLGAQTGQGKSTAAANIIRRVIAEKNPITDKTGRCLLITNEENIADFYNRITCLLKGWHYVNHDQFTAEQKKEFSEMIIKLRHRITVVDDTHVSNGVRVTGQTTTVEGIESIFDNLIRDNEFYDCVILDYYQGVTESTKDPTLNEYQVQRKLTQVLEKYRKSYPAPIVVLAQINPPEKNKDGEDRVTPMQTRVQGTKIICTRATVIIEMVAHRKDLMTEWIVHKGRYAQSVGEAIKTGYDNGLFVSHTDEFKRKVQANKEKWESDGLNKIAGVKPKEEVKDGQKQV